MFHLSTTTQVSDSLLEVSQKPRTLLTLHLSVLDRTSSQMLIKFNRLVSSNGSL